MTDQTRLPVPSSPAFPIDQPADAGKWMVLLAAFLGWMFDGLEMGLFPLVARPALQELMGPSAQTRIGTWMSLVIAVFLVGAALGGIFFGWLGDRIGRVRAMVWSVLVYSIFSGLCGFAQAPWHLAALRFIAALGMGGEWSLGVALVMEIWPSRHRPILAGLIGAASNVGFLLIAFMGLALSAILGSLSTLLHQLHLPPNWTNALLANSAWRLLLFLGALPALLTFLIRIFVPESERWRQAADNSPKNRVADIFEGRLASLTILGTVLGAIALLGTWGSVQWIPSWADKLANDRYEAALAPSALPRTAASSAVNRFASTRASTGNKIKAKSKAKPVNLAVLQRNTRVARSWAQIASGSGAIFGCIIAACCAQWTSRRWTYFALSLASLAACQYLFRAPMHFSLYYLVWVAIVGGLTAAFYGWLPLYLPELFPTRVCATAQGFAFNFGRVLAAGGTLVSGGLLNLFKEDYARMCSYISLIYLAGLIVIWAGPETKGRPLPD